jgi:pre-mRNA-splicing factor 38A
MASSDALTRSVRRSNPHELVEKIVRMRIFESAYWKEHCFGLTAELLVDKATSLTYYGGVCSANNKPTPFLCLIMKMLQLRPEMEIVREFIQIEEYKYVRVLGAFYLRLVGTPVDIYTYLEPLYSDYSKIAFQTRTGWGLSTVDQFVDTLLTDEFACDIALPHLPARHNLESRKLIGPRESLVQVHAIDKSGGAAAGGVAMDGYSSSSSSSSEDEDEAGENGGATAANEEVESASRAKATGSTNAVSETTNAVSETTNAVSETTKAVSETTNAVSETTNAVSGTEIAPLKSTAGSEPVRCILRDALPSADGPDVGGKKPDTGSSSPRAERHRDADRSDDRDRDRDRDRRGRNERTRDRRRSTSRSRRREPRRRSSRRSRSRREERRGTRKRSRRTRSFDSRRSRRSRSRERTSSRDRNQRRHSGEREARREERTSEPSDRGSGDDDDVSMRKKTKEKKKKKRVFKGLKSVSAQEGGDGGEAAGKTHASAEGSVEQWNETRAKLGLKPLRP